MTALKIGDRVRLTEYARQKNITLSRRKCRSGQGVIVRIKDGHPDVKWDGYAIPQGYHPDFIEKVKL